MSGRFRFADFLLDLGDRRLRREGAPVELSARYFDALALLVGARGQLVSKDRFMAEVWRGVPVTDEALTQCIRSLRRQLDDDAARPRFIETVPKHGYRFIAAVRSDEEPAPDVIPPAPAAAQSGWGETLLLGGAGTLGAGLAGALGGLFYGVTALRPAAGPGGASALLVLVWLTIVVALTGGAGVSFGIALAARAADRRWLIAGGAAGGLFVGGTIKLLGLDAFNLLLGRAPDGITGAPEGALLGAAVGLGAWMAAGGDPPTGSRRRVAVAALVGGIAAALLLLLGGRLMGGSLDLLARTFPGSNLRLAPFGGMFGEDGFGPIARYVTGIAEGALFTGCVVGAMWRARIRLAGKAAPPTSRQNTAASPP